jgi:hypothetical protein
MCVCVCVCACASVRGGRVESRERRTVEAMHMRMRSRDQYLRPLHMFVLVVPAVEHEARGRCIGVLVDRGRVSRSSSDYTVDYRVGYIV